MQGVVSSIVSDSELLPSDAGAPTDVVSGPPVFTLDAPCLPGMEGAPVLGLSHACQGPHFCAQQCKAWQRSVLGVLSLPLSRVSDGVQIQVRTCFALHGLG